MALSAFQLVTVVPALAGHSGCTSTANGRSCSGYTTGRTAPIWVLGKQVGVRLRVVADGRGERLGRRERVGDVVLGNVLLHTAAKRLEQGIDAIHLGLELETETDTAPGLLPLEIDTVTIVASTPGARRLGPITFYLSGFAKLASASGFIGVSYQASHHQ